MSKKYFSVILGMFLVVFFTMFLVFAQMYYHTPLLARNHLPVDYYFAQGKTTHQLVQELHALNIVEHPRILLAILRLLHKDHSLRAGEYRIEPGMTLHQLLAKLITGDVIRYRFTLVEGWKITQIQDELHAMFPEEPDALHRDPFLKLKTLQSNNYASATNMEGLFFPDTYVFVKGIDATDLLIQAQQRMQKKLNEAWLGRAKNLPYTSPYEALIVASLIEKETAIPEERPLVAGVILNRLKLKMRLQIDASVIYGLGSHYKGVLYSSDLTSDTPYNTYRHAHLPPTPICSPGYAALHAALHPKTTDKLYYVAKSDGTHHFSRDLDEHHRAVALYQQSNKNDTTQNPTRDVHHT